MKETQFKAKGIPKQEGADTFLNTIYLRAEDPALQSPEYLVTLPRLSPTVHMKSESNLAPSPALHAGRAQGYMVAVEARLRDAPPLSRTVTETAASSFFFRQGLSGSGPS